MEDWEIVVEQAVEVSDGRGFASAPIVVPLEVGAPPSIVVLDGQEDRVLAIDARSGSTEVIESLAQADIEFLAWALPPSEGERVFAIWNNTDWGVSVSSSPSRWTHVPTEYGVAPSIVDLDWDARPDVLFGELAVSSDGDTLGSWPTRIRYLSNMLVTGDAGEPDTITTGSGAYELAGEAVADWSRFGNCNVGFGQVYPVQTDSDVRWLGVDCKGPFGLDVNGGPIWGGVPDRPREYPEVTGMASAIGDADGDDQPDLCFIMGRDAVVVSSAGTVLLDADMGVDEAWRAGGCVFADLNADGRDEVIAYGTAGLQLFDVGTGELLARGSMYAESWEQPPVVADVDGDGSAEIVVTAISSSGATLYVLGPAEGRWARTRPVWNQFLYDPTLIGDDGRLMQFPRSNPDTIQRYRSQPARDGDLPDLIPEVIDACATSCEDGVVSVSVRVRNEGSADSAPGARLTLYTGDETVPLQQAASVVLSEGIPAGWASAAVALTVQAEDWGSWRLMQVDGDASGECDILNDRIEIDSPDPCPS